VLQVLRTRVRIGTAPRFFSLIREKQRPLGTKTLLEYSRSPDSILPVNQELAVTTKLILVTGLLFCQA
jgi:hypothetical protein